jgi:hypothetical protein
MVKRCFWPLPPTASAYWRVAGVECSEPPEPSYLGLAELAHASPIPNLGGALRDRRMSIDPLYLRHLAADTVNPHLPLALELRFSLSGFFSAAIAQHRLDCLDRSVDGDLGRCFIGTPLHFDLALFHAFAADDNT